jgi:predicted metalloprotease with PDZ domain
MAVLGLAIGMTQERVAGQNSDRKATGSEQTRTETPGTKVKANERGDGKVKSRRGHALGMSVEAQGNQGILISQVEDPGLASKAGLRANDRIVSADNRPFRHPRQLEAYLASHGGRPIPIVVVRDNQQQTIMYTPPMRSGDSAWLGVFLEEGDADAKGARITQVYPGGPAARAGLQPGDTIIQVNKQRIESAADLIDQVAQMEPQTEAQFSIMRDQKEEQVPVVLGTHHNFAQAGADHDFTASSGQAQNGNHAFENVPPHAMQLEHDRRAAEQHQRIEQQIEQLRDEIHQLREELKQQRK